MAATWTTARRRSGTARHSSARVVCVSLPRRVSRSLSKSRTRPESWPCWPGPMSAAAASRLGCSCAANPGEQRPASARTCPPPKMAPRPGPPGRGEAQPDHARPRTQETAFFLRGQGVSWPRRAGRGEGSDTFPQGVSVQSLPCHRKTLALAATTPPTTQATPVGSPAPPPLHQLPAIAPHTITTEHPPRQARRIRHGRQLNRLAGGPARFGLARSLAPHQNANRPPPPRLQRRQASAGETPAGASYRHAALAGMSLPCASSRRCTATGLARPTSRLRQTAPARTPAAS